MITKKFAASLLAIALTSLLGCVQYPTEHKSVVDLRPQISFRFNLADARMNEARILIDGLDSGRMGDFIDGQGSLRVLPGTHAVRIVSDTGVLVDERVYLGDGVTRPFIVK
ncbi:MAG: hypothetical protein ABI606_03940 [Rhodoferax sp.]